MKFATYRSDERVVCYLGTWYVIRHDQYPHTTGQVTLQGHSVAVGMRQGNTYDGGYAVRRWSRPDTMPRYTPEGYRD